MLYLEDYLELIEHLPQELRDRLTLIRENDLKVNNTNSQIDSTVKQFFAQAKDLTSEQRQCDYQKILKEYERTVSFANEKVQLADQTHEIMLKLIQKLDGELEKFKLELEADHAGITEELERRSLELDADTRLDEAIKNHLNGSVSHKHLTGFKDRRRSEHKHQRYHPYQHNSQHQNNGYHVSAKLSQNHQPLYENADDHLPGNYKKQTPQPNRPGIGRFFNQYNPSARQDYSNASSPSPYGNLSFSADHASVPTSMAGDYLMNGSGPNVNGGGHYRNNITSFGNNSGFKYTKNQNSTFNQQHSALSAALSSATTPQHSSISNSHLMNSLSIQNNKISTNNNKGSNNLIDPDSPLVRQDPLAAAASQAIAATQQLHQGRRTSSLKASFAAINGAGLADTLNCKEGRNALAPMAPGQQAYRYNQQYGKLKSNGHPSPLYISVTKSGRPSKRPKHHASHHYPDESPPSFSSDNSVFENSESMSSVDFVDAGNTFGSASPSSFDYHDVSRVSDQGDGGSVFYQRDETKYCICRQISYGAMVACDHEDCEIEWFHYGCVGISHPPKGKWFCPECTQKMNSHQQHHHNSSSQQTQTHKKRGRREILGN